jgi:hypothetical protein
MGLRATVSNTSLTIPYIGWLVGWLVYSCPVKRFVSLQFLNLRHSVGLLGRGISPSQGRYLTRTQNKHRQTSMSRMGFEPTIPVFERAKSVHALDRAAILNIPYITFKQLTGRQDSLREPS